MAKELLQAQRRGTKALLDPRTKLLLVVTIATIIISGGGGKNTQWQFYMDIVRFVLTAIPLVLFLVEKKWSMAVKYTIICACAFLCNLLLLPSATGFLNFILVALCGIFARFLPGIAMGAYLVNTTTVSEFMAAMERMRLPQKLSIPLSVVFRFFPTVGEEYGAIRDAMRMRGIRFGGRKPSKMLEYCLVPLMVSCVKIGDELSAAALTRGLGAPVRRTNICRIGFGLWDALAVAVCATSMLLFLFARIAG